MLEELQDLLVAEGTAALAAAPGLIRFTGNDDADLLLDDLADHPHAFVLAALVDRQVRAERTCMMPLVIRQRLGSFEIRDLEPLAEQQWRSAAAPATRGSPDARNDGAGVAPCGSSHRH